MKFSEGYVDFHSHILPDRDCSGDIKDAVFSLGKAFQCGIRTVIATPHFYPHADNVESFISFRDSSFAALKAETAANPHIPCLFPGAEVLLCDGLDRMPEIGRLCIGKSNTILIEMPDTPWKSTLIETLENIRSKCGLNVIIAHADRYPAKEDESLIRHGFTFQLNADGLCSLTGRRRLIEYIENGFVSAIGSDIHVGRDKHPYSDYSHAIKILGDRAEAIFAKTSEMIFYFEANNEQS